MNRRRVPNWIALITLALLASIQPVRAHDVRGLFANENLPENVRARIDERQDIQTMFADLAVPPSFDLSALESIIRRTATWVPGDEITVCFFEGDQAVRKRVADIAVEWTKYGNIAFDFGTDGQYPTCDVNTKYDIRVSFRGVGYSSFVGTDSLLIPAERQTLNLEDYDHAPPPDRKFVKTTLHEFGHALGYEHEHQSPLASCEDEFDWPLIYRTLPWPKNKIDHNLRRLPNSSAYQISEYDKKSIMHYSLSARLFRNGAASDCFIPPNYELSERDKVAMAMAYPEIAERMLSEEMPAFELLISESELDESQRQKLDSLYERLDRFNRERQLSEE